MARNKFLVVDTATGMVLGHSRYRKVSARVVKTLEGAHIVVADTGQAGALRASAAAVMAAAPASPETAAAIDAAAGKKDLARLRGKAYGLLRRSQKRAGKAVDAVAKKEAKAAAKNAGNRSAGPVAAFATMSAVEPAVSVGFPAGSARKLSKQIAQVATEDDFRAVRAAIRAARNAT